MSKSSKDYMAKVAQLPCVVCGTHGVQVHHLRHGQGMGQRSSDFMVVPLCIECHTGANGIHGNKSFMNMRKLSELDLLARTIEALNK